MQSLQPSSAARYNGRVLEAIRTIVKLEGVKTPFRGINIVAAGAGPAHALYFATYEASKKFLSTKKSGHHPLAHGNKRNENLLTKRNMLFFLFRFSGCSCYVSP